MKENDQFLKFALCALVQDLKDNNEDIENEMKKIGHIFCRSALEILDFNRETDLQSLLYNITYTLLEKIHSSPRKLEISSTNNKEYFIFEYEPFFTKHVPLTETWKDFCPESVMTGVIEYAIAASGFKCEVSGYVRPIEKYPDTVVYFIKVHE
ncbi:trafficking protein particle complex subunit [Vairimorpha necatrix]|uniref:Trafficking protein particle complex subunit n=1 Tax=Vairimorpha necatrix TaxID=6039 RepID=A0AAX4J8G1_9MICR